MLEGRHVEEEAWLEKERQRLAKERELLEEERRTFAEATIRLNREVSTTQKNFGTVNFHTVQMYICIVSLFVQNYMMSVSFSASLKFISFYLSVSIGLTRR